MEEAYSRGGPGWSRTRLVLKAGMPVLFLAMAVVGAMLLTSNDRAQSASEPCADGVGASIQSTPKAAGQVNIGDQINYTVTFRTPWATVTSRPSIQVSPCPTGTNIPLLENFAFPANTTVTCPGNAACVTAGPYSYTIAAADLEGPNPSGAARPPGARRRLRARLSPRGRGRRSRAAPRPCADRPENRLRPGRRRDQGGEGRRRSTPAKWPSTTSR